MSKQEIYDHLKVIGCCNICCLRFLNGHFDEFNDADAALISRKIYIEQSKEMDDELSPKRRKTNSCVACLGVLDPDNISKVLETILSDSRLKMYDSPTVLSTISLPIMLSIRQLSIWIDLIEKFPNNYSSEKCPDIHLKEVVKLSINPTICSKTGRTFEQNQNGLMINVFFEHDDDDEEIKQLEQINPKMFQERVSSRKFHRQFITRNAFEKHFSPKTLDFELYKKFVQVPPKIVDTSIRFVNFTIVGPTVFLAGRYRKLSRALCQTPWILQGKRVMENSLQEIVSQQVAPMFGISDEKIVFLSSGREDVDVRCLGKGRPFVMEIPDSRRTKLSRDEAAKMEEEIEKCDILSVQHLQIVRREDTVHIKTGEESKQKHYRALCVLEEESSVELLKKLNTTGQFTIKQATPIRVLHRRPLLTRSRHIYSLKATIDPNNLKCLILDIVTQAGTYIKELIHGEFGRTVPSICSLIGQSIDIVALDVTAIDLDWPNEIDNRNMLDLI